jgi:hypothetical protein
MPSGRLVEIKGTALMDTIKAIKARAGEQEFARIVSLLDGDAKAIFESPISPSSWYSLDAFVEFLETDIRETAHGDRTVLIARAEKVIEAQLRGVYKVFIQMGSPAFVIKRIAAVHATYFRGVNIIPELDDSNLAVIKYAGFASRHEIMSYAIIGFFRKALDISGAKQVKVEFSIPISAGGDYAELLITWA